MKVGSTVKAFHPRTMGVVYSGKVLKIEDTRVRIAFNAPPDKSGRTSFWIPLNHAWDPK